MLFKIQMLHTGVYCLQIVVSKKTFGKNIYTPGPICPIKIIDCTNCMTGLLTACSLICRLQNESYVEATPALTWGPIRRAWRWECLVVGTRLHWWRSRLKQGGGAGRRWDLYPAKDWSGLSQAQNCLWGSRCWTLFGSWAILNILHIYFLIVVLYIPTLYEFSALLTLLLLDEVCWPKIHCTKFNIGILACIF